MILKNGDRITARVRLANRSWIVKPPVHGTWGKPHLDCNKRIKSMAIADMARSYNPLRIQAMRRGVGFNKPMVRICSPCVPRASCEIHFFPKRTQSKGVFKTHPKQRTLGQMLGADCVQRTGFDAIPAPHAHILKYHGLFKGAIDLFQYFGGCRLVLRRSGPPQGDTVWGCIYRNPLRRMIFLVA